MNQNILYYCSDNIILFEWKKNTLVNCVEFDNNEEGYALFREIMPQFAFSPIKILFNIQGEEYHKETIPHVKGKSRTALIDRLIKKQYRDEQYVKITSQGREKEGRKDENILLSSLSLSDNLQKWIDLIDEVKLKVCGIWSTPFLIEKMIPHINKDVHDYIFITKSMDGRYRQSLFINNKLVISRKLSTGKKGGDDEVNDLVSSYDQLYKYSTNQRLLKNDDKIHFIFCIEEDIYNKIDHHDNNENITHSNIRSDDIANSFQLAINTKSSIDLIHSYLCSIQSRDKPHYSTASNNLYYKKDKSKKRIFALYTLFIVSLFLISGIIDIKNYYISREIHENTQNYLLFSEEYEENFSSIQEKLLYADEVGLLLDKANLSLEQSKSMPTDIFYELSLVMDKEESRRFSITQLKWKRYSGTELEAISKHFASNEVVDEAIANSADGDLGMEPEEDSKESAIFIHIIGDFNYSDLSYKAAVNKILFLNNSLKTMEKASGVYMLSSPIDLRLEAKYSGFRGTQVSKILDKNISNRFEFIVKLDNTI